MGAVSPVKGEPFFLRAFFCAEERTHKLPRELRICARRVHLFKILKF